MPLDVTLGGLTWRWQLKDDHPVEDWLSRRPWLGDGGVIVVQAPDDQSSTIGALEKAVFGADGRASEVRVVVLPAAADDLAQMLVSWLGTTHHHQRSIALALAEDLAIRPTVFVIDARAARPPKPWTEDAFALWDLAAKLEVARRPTFVVLHLRGEAPLRGRYDLHRGWPVGLARSLFEVAPANLWPQYVHLRFAWETGGIIDDGMECATSATGTRQEDDDEFEQGLNNFATAKFRRLPDTERRAWLEYVEHPSSADATPTVLGYPEHIDDRLTPFPW